MTTTTYNLFDTRGSTTFQHRCEVCNDPLDPLSLTSTCPGECSIEDRSEEED
jgi:hypothetical protein